MLLPLVLIFMDTGLNTAGEAGWVDGDAAWFNVLRTLGSTTIALLVTVFVASYVLGTRRGKTRAMIEDLVNSALGPVAAIILITGAGGMFGGVLRASGIGDALSEAMSDIGLPVIAAAFIIATVLRIAQGSATVALTATAGLVQPIVAGGDYNGVQLAAIVIAIGAGSVMASHVNDSGFWLVGRFLEMDVKTTLKTWTVMETLIGLVGFALAAGIFALASIGS
ncbi:hypothetical protein GCM10029992_55580 [Glycomyces albus]